MSASAPELEYQKPGDPLRNYCLWDYQPMAPLSGKICSVNLLYDTFALKGVEEEGRALVTRIREIFSHDQTVWGVKLIDGDLRWEFYFYDYLRTGRTRSLSRLLDGLSPLIRSPLQTNEALPYFMFSLDLTPELLRGETTLDDVNLYLGNPGSTVSSGVSYRFSPAEMRLQNFYFFFEATKQREEIRAKVFSSPFVADPQIDSDTILWPELMRCHTVCVANKQANDCIYFSGINIDQFIFFLIRLNYPASLVDSVSERRSQFSHLLFDVGFDYRVTRTGLEIIKSGYYGAF